MKYYVYITPILFLACGSPPQSSAPSSSPSSSPRSGSRSGSASASDPASPPVFIEDDYAGALAKAKAQHVPLFVDSWASWCHSCVSMKNFVFTDPRLATETTRFVWLSIDTENAKNAEFLAKFPSEALPTLRVIDPESGQAKAVSTGTLTTPELIAMLNDASGAKSDLDARHAREGDTNLLHMAMSGQMEACAARALELAKTLPSGTQRVDVAVGGTSCALELPKDAQQKYLPALVKELQAIVHDPKLVILADDRSSAYEALVDAGEASGEKTAVHENAAAWAKFLEDEAAKAKTPAERAVFDPHRLLAYLALGEPVRAIPMLEQSQKDFPDDFNPPARLARAYTELGKYDDAIASSDKALALAHGPRRVRIELGKADAQSKKGDKAGEKKTLEDTLAFIATLPAAQTSTMLKTAVEDRLKKIAR